ncbi:hypothetical protein CF326_g3354 [Tilletia indica]|nr:hypothetical protein CF326_g3354 [Tilletia indica]
MGRWGRDYDDMYESHRDDEVDAGGSDLDNDDGEDGSVEYDTEGPLVDLGKELAAATGEIGDFSFGGSADFLPAVPGLFIEGVGKIVLPLIDEQLAEKIIKVCEQAPFGRGFDTLVDTSVRNSWQLDPSKVKLQNPRWEAGIESAAPLIAAKFGVAGTPITLHLYKFLLYKVGGHFAKHRDTEKEDRMFATMVVQLPSIHKGGHLQVFKDGAKNAVIHDFGAAAGTAEYQCNYACHFADAEHAVQPITEGYRLALVYSICWPANTKQPPPSLSRDSQTPMLRALAELAEEDRDFHYYFEHSYTQKSISELGIGCLKGQDRARVANLRTANNALPPQQQFTFYLIRGQRATSYYGMDYSHDGDEWEESDSPRHIYSSPISLNGRILATSEIDLDDANVLNPDNLTRIERWSGHRTTTYEGNLGNEGPTKDTRYEKYLLLAWPAKTAEDRILALAGVNSHFTNMLSASASSELVRKFVQRIVNMKAAGTFKPERENKFGRALYKHIASVPNLHDLLPVYFDLFPRGTYAPETPAPSSYYTRYYTGYGMTATETTGNPFIDIIQTIQHSGIWQKLGDKIINDFAGQILPTLDLMEEVKKSTVLQSEIKYQIVKKLLGLFRHQIPPTPMPDGRSKEALQRKLWPAVLASEGSESFKDLARTYIAYFPQGAYASPQLDDKQRFGDLPRLAASPSAWEVIRATVTKAFDNDMEGALIFVHKSMQQSLPRTVWQPFLDISLKLCEVQEPALAPVTPSFSPFYEFSRPRPTRSTLLKAMWNTAMLLNARKEDVKSDSDAAAKLLKRYIAMAPTGLAGLEYGIQTPNGDGSFTDLIQIAQKFPSVWETSKCQILRAMASDMKLVLRFVKQCRLANLPEAVWGSSVEVCARLVALPKEGELDDVAFQNVLWHVAIDVPAPKLCQASVARYMVVPTANATKAVSALTTICKADLRSFKSKLAVLEPLLRYWLKGMEEKVQMQHNEANKWIFPDGTIPSRPDLRNFLRSPQISTKIVGQFSGIGAARICASRIIFQNCSGTAEAGGRGKDAYVTVTKKPTPARQLEAERKETTAMFNAIRELLLYSDQGGPAAKKQKVGKA